MSRVHSFINRANSPIQRVGLVLVGLSLAYFIVMACHWNLFVHGFVYRAWDSRSEKVLQPAETETISWRSGFKTIVEPEYPYSGLQQSGWVSYDKQCLKAHRPLMNVFETPPAECRLDFVPDSIVHMERVTRQTLTDFSVDLFSRHTGGKYSVSLSAVVALVFGVLMFVGIADKFLLWIKSGKT